MSGDLLRLVDSIHRDKDIDKDIIFDALEDALLSAARRYYGPKSDMAVFVDRESGTIQAFDGNKEVDGTHLGRIAAQSAKQVIIQRIRDAEQDSLFREYESRVKQIVSGTIQRFEGSTIIVNLGRAEGILPRSEQVQEEGYRIGERIRCLLLEVRRMGTRVRILLSRANHDLIRRLFELEVPEIGERVIEIMAIAREPGHRTKVAVASADIKVDCVGACVGVRGSRIKNIVAELNDEKIDIVRWSDARDVLIANSLKPAEIREVIVASELNRARVVVPEEELSLAIGKRGRNVRLAAKLCEVDIDILSEAEGERELKDLNTAFGELEGLPERFPQRVYQMGYSVEDIAEGALGWAERFDLDEDIVAMVVKRSKTAAEEIAVARAQAEVEAAEAEAQAEAEAAEAEAAEAEAAAQEDTGEEADADAEPDADEGTEAQTDDDDAAPQATEDAAPAEPEAEQPDAGDPPAEELPAEPAAPDAADADPEPTADDTDAPGTQAEPEDGEGPADDPTTTET
ncbi:MAG: transcription termination factor NusA [Candidatus Brocadiae bacterium]|nr:transcription termination factor NusA [Candidatus Brocadiia bacterium]